MADPMAELSERFKAEALDRTDHVQCPPADIQARHVGALQGHHLPAHGRRVAGIAGVIAPAAGGLILGLLDVVGGLVDELAGLGGQRRDRGGADRPAVSGGQVVAQPPVHAACMKASAALQPDDFSTGGTRWT